MRDNTIQCHSFKPVNNLTSQQTFPTTTQHVHVVKPIMYAAHTTLQILTQPYDMIMIINKPMTAPTLTFLCDSTSQRIHHYFRKNYKEILKRFV